MSVQSFPSPRQNTGRGVKWLIVDQTSQAPPLLHPQAKNEDMQDSSQTAWEDSYWRSQVNQLGTEQNLAPCKRDRKGLRTKWMDLVHLFALSGTQHSQLTQKWKQFWSSVPLLLPGTAIQSGLTHCWGNESKPAHVRTPTESSQLIPWYSPQNQPG